MRNKVVGILVIGIAILIGFITYSFNVAMTNIVKSICTHGDACPMWGTLNFQTNVSLAIMAFVILVGIYLIFFSREEKIVTRIKKVKEQVKPKEITKESYKKIMAGLSSDEKRVFEVVIDSKGTVLQSDLIVKTEFNKVKVTRILDKLEGRGLIERKRRGMSNVVILKH